MNNWQLKEIENPVWLPENPYSYYKDRNYAFQEEEKFNG